MLPTVPGTAPCGSTTKSSKTDPSEGTSYGALYFFPYVFYLTPGSRDRFMEIYANSIDLKKFNIHQRHLSEGFRHPAEKLTILAECDRGVNDNLYNSRRERRCTFG